MRQLTLVFLLFICCELESQSPSKIVTHITEYSSSNVKVTKWNTEPHENESYVRETIDSEGRTSKLEFFHWDNKLFWPGSGFYGGPIIKYNYEDEKIIETFFAGENEMANDFKYSEAPFRFIYTLDEQFNIINLESIFKIEFEHTIKSLKETIEHLELYKSILEKAKPEEEYDEQLFSPWYVEDVFGYNFAIGKLNGKHPIRKE